MGSPLTLKATGSRMSEVLSPKDIVAALTEFWSPRIIAGVDDVYVKVAKIHGTLAWHKHEFEDELFFILKGRLRIENGGPGGGAFRGRNVCYTPQYSPQSGRRTGVPCVAYRTEINTTYR